VGEAIAKEVFKEMAEEIAREVLKGKAADSTTPGGTDADQSERELPGTADAYSARGIAWCEEGKFDEAIADFNEALRLEPQNARALVNRGNAWDGKKDFDKAIADFTEAIRLDPKLAAAYGNRSLTWQDLGEYEKAASDIEEMIRLEPNSVFALGNCAWLLATCPDDKCRDGKRAVKLATTACELSGWVEVDDIDTLAAAYAEVGDFENAIKWQERALELAPPADRVEFRDRLALFKSGQPYRDEPMK
jgi:tetratricopeptide (TPR) repeat protein